MKKRRTLVILTNAIKLRRMHETVKPTVDVEDVITRAYWNAWMQGEDKVMVTFNASQTRSRMEEAWMCKLEEFELREVME